MATAPGNAPRLAGGAAHTAVELLTGLRVHADRMRANLDITGGAIVAERPFGPHLAPHLGKAAAMRAVATAAGRGGELAEESAQDGDVLAVLDADTLKRLCDPTEHLGVVDDLVQGPRAGSAG